MAGPYYTLIASLPRLVYFERARTLPINPERLRQRLGMLVPDDAATVAIAREVLEWERQPIERSDAEIVRRHEQVVAGLGEPTLRAIIEFQMSLRTLTAALRRRRLGRPRPDPGERFGIPPYDRAIRRHWDDPDFRLGAVLPWLPELRRRLDTGPSLELERFLLALGWNRLSRLGNGEPFGFGAVLIYLGQWDIVRRWLLFRADPAARRFEHLLEETLGDHGPLFARA